MIFYESPYRLEEFLADAISVYGDRRAALANDLTKMFENVERGTLTQLAEKIRGVDLKGEYTVVISGAEGKHRKMTSVELEDTPYMEDLEGKND